MAICPPRSYTPYKQDTRAADNNVCEMSTLETVNQNKSYLLTSSTISFTRVCIKRTLSLSLCLIWRGISHFSNLNCCAKLMKRVWSVKNVCKNSKRNARSHFEMWNFENFRFVSSSVCVSDTLHHWLSTMRLQFDDFCTLFVVFFLFVFAFVCCYCFFLLFPLPIKLECIATQFWIPNNVVVYLVTKWHSAQQIPFTQ